MAYAHRSSRSDVHVIESDAGYECLSCALAAGGRTLVVATIAEMIAHLETHRSAGQKVPDEAFTWLREDAR
jgi:hypothetical protein